MRITGGIHGSRKLSTPANDAVRPTSDKVRQAVFNMLQARGLVDGAVVIDAFCGTGALGLEALSRGAKFAYFFDKDKKSYMLARSNVAALGEEGRTAVALQDITKIKPRAIEQEAADLIFLDPPYHKNLITPTLDALMVGHWMKPEAYFVVESAKSEEISHPKLSVLSEKIYGDTKIILAEGG